MQPQTVDYIIILYILRRIQVTAVIRADFVCLPFMMSSLFMFLDTHRDVW